MSTAANEEKTKTEQQASAESGSAALDTSKQIELLTQEIENLTKQNNELTVSVDSEVDLIILNLFNFIKK